MNESANLPTPERIFKRYLWRSVVKSGSPSLESFTTWTLTGVGATAALLLANIDSLDDMVTTRGIAIVLLMLAISLLTGAVSKQIGLVLPSAVTTSEQVENDLATDAGQRLMDAMNLESAKLSEQLAEPFLWPVNRFVRAGGDAGGRDFHANDRRFVRVFCLQLWFFWAHALLAIVTLPVVALSLK